MNATIRDHRGGRKYAGVPLTAIYALGARDGWQCHYCGVQVHPQDRPPLVFKMVRTRPAIPGGPPGRLYQPLNYQRAYGDHVVPRSQHGRTVLSNLVLACMKCNSRKRGQSYQDYIAGHPAARPLAGEVQL